MVHIPTKLPMPPYVELSVATEIFPVKTRSLVFVEGLMATCPMGAAVPTTMKSLADARPLMVTLPIEPNILEYVRMWMLFVTIKEFTAGD